MSSSANFSGSDEFLARQEQLSWREVDGEIVLLDERDWTYLHLNGTGAALWKTLCEGPAAVDALVDTLLATYDVSRHTALADVESLLRDLLSRGLITAIRAAPGA